MPALKVSLIRADHEWLMESMKLRIANRPIVPWRATRTAPVARLFVKTDRVAAVPAPGRFYDRL